MKGHLLATLVLIASAISSYAAELPTSQWKIVGLSLFDLLQAGYRIAAVTSNPSSDGASTETFFLQKNEGTYKCIEVHVTDVKARESVALFNCFELVQPYTPPRAK